VLAYCTVDLQCMLHVCMLEVPASLRLKEWPHHYFRHHQNTSLLLLAGVHIEEEQEYIHNRFTDFVAGQ